MDMGCKPLHINVVLLAPGAVKFDIAANQAPHVRLLPDSLYKDYVDSVLKRLTVSQDTNPLPTEVFVRTTVDAVLRGAGGPAAVHELGHRFRAASGFPVPSARVGLGHVLELVGREPRKEAQKKK